MAEAAGQRSQGNSFITNQIASTTLPTSAKNRYDLDEAREETIAAPIAEVRMKAEIRSILSTSNRFPRTTIRLLVLALSSCIVMPVMHTLAQQPAVIMSQPLDPNFTPLTNAEVRRLIRRSDLVARIRIVTFSPATLEEELHSDKIERTSFLVLEKFRGHPPAGILKMVCICSGDTWSADTKPGRELLLFARYNQKDRLYEPVGEGYEQDVYPKLCRQILAETRRSS